MQIERSTELVALRQSNEGCDISARAHPAKADPITMDVTTSMLRAQLELSIARIIGLPPQLVGIVKSSRHRT